LINRQATRRCTSYVLAGDRKQSGEYRKNKAGISRSAKDEKNREESTRSRKLRRVFPSASAGSDFFFFVD